MSFERGSIPSNPCTVPLALRRRLNNDDDDEDAEKWTLCHRSLLHELRSHFVLDFVSKNYDSTLSEVAAIVLQHGLSTLRREGSSTLRAEWRRSAERAEQRTVYRHSVLDLQNESPLENRHSIGKQRGSDEQEQYALSFAISKRDIMRSLAAPAEDEAVDEWLGVLSEGNEVLNELSDVLPVLVLRSNAYSVNVRGIMDHVQLLDVQKLVHCRFDSLSAAESAGDPEEEEEALSLRGQEGAASRLFGALMAMRKVGEKQLAELCMMRQSTVKQVLYRMLSDHFVAIEYVPKTPDRDCIKSFFLWSIDWVAIHKKVLQSMYDAVSNLLVKKRSVRKQIEIAEHDDAHKASDHAKTRWKRLCAAFEHLAAIIQRVDLQIALHRDF